MKPLDILGLKLLLSVFVLCAVASDLLIADDSEFDDADDPKHEARLKELRKEADFIIYANDSFDKFFIGVTNENGVRTLFSWDQIERLLRDNIVGKKTILFLSYNEHFEDEKGMNSDAFYALLRPDLMESGFKRFIVASSEFNYDSLEDPHVIWRTSKIAKLSSCSTKQYMKQCDIDGIENKYMKPYDDEEENYEDDDDYLLPMDELKLLGDGGDDDALWLYASKLLDKKDDCSMEDGLKILDKLASEGHFPSIRSLAYFYEPSRQSENSDPDKETTTESERKKYENAETSEKYKFMSLNFGYFYFFSKLIEDTVEEGNLEKAEEIFFEYADGVPLYAKSQAAEVIAMHYWGYSISETYIGCFHSGAHLSPDFNKLKNIKNVDKAVFWTDYLVENTLGTTGLGTDAFFLKAHIYLNGIGVEKNASKAVDWVMRALYEGDIQAAAYMAYAYERGIGVEKSKDKSDLFWKKVFETDMPSSSDAILKASRRFYNGFGFPKDKLMAIEILERAFEQGKARKASHYTNTMLYTLIRIFSGKYSESDKNAEKLESYEKFEKSRFD